MEERVDAPKPMTAFVGTMFVGTERLDRPLTDPERAELAALLRAHDFVGASLVALRFAFKLRRSKPAAQDLHGRANLRLVRLGWDPLLISLLKCLCRYVWSEHTHEVRESAATRRAEEIFLREQGIHEGTSTRSAEDEATRIETERRDQERAMARLDELRAAFVAARDEVNLLWLDYMRKEISDPREMARLSGRDVKELYLAADRRKRHVKRLLAAPPTSEVRAGAPKDQEDK
jgi:hypothetical protein